MKRFLILALSLFGLNYIFSQPPGSPKNTPGSDTSTVEMDAGKARDPQKQRSDTASNIPKGPRKKK